MSLHDDIIRRWLDEAAADAAPRLDRDSAGAEGSLQYHPGVVDEVEEETKRLVARLRLVQGLLSTLDLKTAPEELGARVEAEHVRQEQAAKGVDEICEVPLAEWVDAAALEPIFEPCKAPEFLDRIVEQRMAAMQDSDQAEAARTNNPLGRKILWTGPRRLMAGAVLALLLLAAPLFLGERAGFFGAESNNGIGALRLVNYDSLEGLQNAFPSQSQAANGMGILGAFGAPGQESGGPR